MLLATSSSGTGPRHQPYAPASPLTPESMSADVGPSGHHSSSTTTMDDLVSHQGPQSQPSHHPQPLPSPSTPSGNVLTPTWRGMVMSTIDALKIIEACLTGVLMHTARRPHDREREHLIRSGNVFVYEESSSGIKRWTDGQNWSPSRILGNYLIYRELDKNFPPGDKKRAIKRKRDGKPELQNGHPGTPGAPTTLNDERERALLGSLIDSYPFKEGGLIKKTISIKWNNVMHHLVSYYSLEDARNHRLAFPNDDPKLVHLRPRPELIQLQDFRVPVEQEDPRFLDDHALLMTMLPHGSYAPTPTLERTLSLPQMNNMMQNPYSTSQFHMTMPVHNPMGSGMPMSNHYGPSSTSFVSWDQQRSRAPSLQMPPFGSNIQDMMHSSSKRRRSDAYDSGEQDMFSPLHGHDLTRGGQHYLSASTSSYSVPSLPAPVTDSHDYKPAVSQMAPPPVTTSTPDGLPTSTSLSYASPSMSTSSSLDFPSAITVAQPPVSTLSGTNSSVDFSLTPTLSSLTASTLDTGSNRGDSHHHHHHHQQQPQQQFYTSFNPPSWGSTTGTPHDNSSYVSSSSARTLNGWHNAPASGSHH